MTDPVEGDIVELEDLQPMAPLQYTFAPESYRYLISPVYKNRLPGVSYYVSRVPALK